MFNANGENKIFEQAAVLAEKIEKAKNILIFTHKNPDADAIGSAMAMARVLSRANKKSRLFLPAPLPERFFYLKESVEIIGEVELPRDDSDLVIGLDCSNLEWSGAAERLAEKMAQGVFLVNIDHHPNSDYGQMNIVASDKSATALVLYNIFNFWKVKIDERLATQILTGIVADTNCFSNAATSAEAYHTASELVRLGARYNYVIAQFHKSDQDGWFGVWSKILSRLTKNVKINLAYSVVLSEDLENGNNMVAEGAANFLSGLSGIEMAMLLREGGNGEIKISLRSLSDKINVAKLAEVFGGGGHEKSAGFTVRGRLEKENNYWQIV